MTTPEKCPFCGSLKDATDMWEASHYECGSWLGGKRSDVDYKPTPFCRALERAQKAEEEVETLEKLSRSTADLLQDSRRENAKLRGLLENTIEKIRKVKWGYDGDCGVNCIIEFADDQLNQPTKKMSETNTPELAIENSARVMEARFHLTKAKIYLELEGIFDEIEFLQDFTPRQRHEQVKRELAAANERAEAYKEIAEWFAHHFSEECGELDHAHDKAFHKNDQDCPVVIKGRTMKAKLEALNQSIKKTGAEI